MHAQAGGDLDTAVGRVLNSLVETSGVRRAGLALSEGGGRRLRFTASDREVEPVPASVALARRFARRQLLDWQVAHRVVDDAVLCLSELVTNVVVHAAASARIELRCEASRVVVTVRDGGGRRTETPSTPDDEPLLVHGRGLRLVASLADDWGSQGSDVGTTVWCSFLR